MVAALGQLIKGNLIVIVPASLLVLLGLGWSEKGVKRQLLAPLSLIIVGVLLAFPATTVIESGANFYHRHQIEFPLPAWIAMGYNQHTKGAFSTADVNRNLHQRTWQARQSNDWAVLKRRLTKPGLIKLSRLALAKLMILTNDANVNFWYNGGPRAAPAWYLQAAPRWEGLVVIIYQSVTGALYWLVSQRLLARQPGLTTVRGTVMVWLVLIALGYLTFHVFLWEVEERYGQVLLPLLLIMLALTRPPQPGAPRIKRQWGIAGLIVGLTWLSGVNVNRVGLNTNLKTVTVAAQRSQLSAQYGAKPWRLRPGQEVSQVINLHQAINYFSVQVHSGSPLVVTLEGPGRTVTLHRRGDCYRDRQPLPAGTYQVRINNPTPRAQPVDVTQVRHYQLAPQPLVWRGHPDRTASLIYDALWRIK